MRARHLIVSTFAVLALSSFFSWATAAGLVSPFSRDSQNLSTTDTQKLQGAIDAALEQGTQGAHVDWSDDASGRAGRATVLRVYKREDAPCGLVEHVFTKGGGNRYELPYCKQPDKSWKITF